MEGWCTRHRPPSRISGRDDVMSRSHLRAGSICVLLVIVPGCREPASPGAGASTDRIRLLAFETYDGSGEVVHPDETGVPGRWGGSASRRMAITPYPGGDARYENPSLFAGRHAGDSWWLEPGAPNPVVMPALGHLSDPDVVLDPDAGVSGELRLYYRLVTDANRILLVRSADGKSWSAPIELFRGPNHTVISPSVVRRGPADWLMWTVNGVGGCTAPSASVELRRSVDGVVWSDPAPVALGQPGFYPWHIDVRWIESLGEYWALYNVKTPGSCTTPAVYLATSTDGIQWTSHDAPVLARGAIPEFEHVVYRSTFAYDEASDAVTFWYSGARYADGRWTWRSAVQTRKRTELFGSLLSLDEPPPTRADVPELEHWP